MTPNWTEAVALIADTHRFADGDSKDAEIEGLQTARDFLESLLPDHYTIMLDTILTKED